MKYAEEKNVESALNYLATTDDEFGRLKGHIRALEYRLKVEEAKGFLSSQGSVEKRKSDARISEEYVAMIDDYETSSCEYLTIGAKRTRAELTIAVWQTDSANHRK